MGMFNNEQIAQNKIRKCFGVTLRSLLLFCVLTTYGGGSSLLQGVAWVSMIPVKILSTGSFEDGVVQTFNGENPCTLCKISGSLRKVENDNSLPDQPHTADPSVKIMEKVVYSSTLFHVISPLRSLVLFQKEPHHTLLKISLEVDIPPPDFV